MRRPRFVPPRAVQSASAPGKENVTIAFNGTRGEEPPRMVFSVLFTKRSTKKRKTYDDGFLLFERSLASLFSVCGKVISKSRYKLGLDDTLPSGSTLTVGTNEIEIVDKLAIEKYDSGKVFLRNTSHDIAPSTTNQSKSSGPQVKRNKPFKPLRSFQPPASSVPPQKRIYQPMYDPSRDDALVLYSGETQLGSVATVVDPSLSRKLRSHQRDGVKFMFDCVTGKGADATEIMKCANTNRAPVAFGNRGGILADEMGLGKTLQTIALIWTVIKQGPLGIYGRTWCNKVCVVTPSSLVDNWNAEFKKWLGQERLQPTILRGTEKKQDGDSKLETFRVSRRHRVLILSYETFRKHSEKLQTLSCLDLLVCDEAHRLKSASGNQTIAALKACRVRRRMLLTGTPVQNDLEEFYAMVDFANPGVLGSDLRAFRDIFQTPIERGADKTASERDRVLASARTDELTSLTNMFILRRSSQVNQRFLPPRTDLEIFLRLTPTQVDLYKKSAAELSTDVLRGRSSGAEAFTLIHRLRQICSHPSLLDCGVGQSRPGSLNVQSATKFLFLDQMLAHVCAEKEKIVIVSNSTKTLDLVGELCKNRGYQFFRLDGSTKSSDRQRLVDRFNSSSNTADPSFVFLLSSKAGGCGLNLIGANRLCLIDLDWNPAIDQQATARIWREGQKKPVFIYRLLATGTIEERIFQRQQLKVTSTSGVVQSQHASSSSSSSSSTTTTTKLKKETAMQLGAFSKEELRQLFQYNSSTDCDTFDLMQSNMDKKRAWPAYKGKSTIPDALLQKVIENVGSNIVSWVHWQDEMNEDVQTDKNAENRAGLSPCNQSEPTSLGDTPRKEDPREFDISDDDSENEFQF